MMGECIAMMESMYVKGVELVQIPIHPDGDPERGPNAGPSFEYVDVGGV